MDKPRKSGDVSDMVHRIKQVERTGMEARGNRSIASSFEREDEYPHVEKATLPVKVSFALTKPELWELISNFDASFEEGAEGNELAALVAAKLHAAYEQFEDTTHGA